MKFTLRPFWAIPFIIAGPCLQISSADPRNLYPDNNPLFQDSSSTSDPFFLLAEDLDKDGEPELIWTNWFNNRIDIYSLKERRILQQKAVSGPFSITLGDVDGDGNQDLVVPYDNRQTSENGLHLLKGNGDGTFQDAVPIKQSIAPGRRCAVADANGDGYPDLITPVGRGTGVYYNDGQGNFGEPSILDQGTATSARAIVLRDFDKDGKPDIALIDYSPGKLQIHHQNENDAPSRFSLQTEITIKAGLIDLEAADLDQDGYEDLIVTSWWSNDTYIYWNRGGQFSSAARLKLATPDGFFYGTDVHVADLNGDGRKEIIRTAHRYHSTYPIQQSSVEAFWRNPANGSWKRVQQTRNETVCRSVAVVDIDKDGTPDLVHTGWTHRKSTDTIEPTEETGQVFHTASLIGQLPSAAMALGGAGPLLRLSMSRPAMGSTDFRLFSSPNLKDWTEISATSSGSGSWSGPSSYVYGDEWVITFEFPRPAAEDQLFYQVRRK